ncbi:hypothetical protein [Methylocystis parvus]|uniref:hypothetical protein n=1 Tax=Methylocystis parvus TaxID=134 RepID=UPI003C70AB00
MIEPDQHAQRVEGEDRREDVEAPGAELVVRQDVAHPGRDRRADEAVLIVPGGVRRGLEEGVDDRRHPQAPAQHMHCVGDEHVDAFPARELTERVKAARDQRGQEEEIDREERRCEDPLDHARKRLVVEQPHAAIDESEIARAPFREERPQGVGDRAAPFHRVVERRVGEELARDRRDLVGVEIPEYPARHEAAEQSREGIDPPTAVMLAAAARQFDGIMRDVDARISERPRQGAEEEAVARARRRKTDHQRDARRHARDGAARIIDRPQISFLEPAEKGRRRVRAFHDRARQREKRGAERGAGDRPRQRDEGHRRRERDDERHGQQQADIDEAIDRAFLGARLPVVEDDHRERRRRAQQAGERLRDQIGLAPKSSLRQRGGDCGQQGGDGRRRIRRNEHDAGRDEGRQRGEEGREREYAMRAPFSRQEAPERQRDADDHRLVQQEQNESASGDLLQGLGRVEAKKEDAADLRDRRRAERDEEAEKKGQEEKRDAQRKARPRCEGNDADDIDSGRDARAGGGEAKELLHCLGRAPQRAGGVAQRREGRDSREVDREVHRLAPALAGRPQQKERRAGEEAGEQRMVPAAARVKRRDGRGSEAEKESLEAYASVRFAMGGHEAPPGRPFSAPLMLNAAFHGNLADSLAGRRGKSRPLALGGRGRASHPLVKPL